MENNTLLTKIAKVETRYQEIKKALEDPNIFSHPDKLSSITKEYKHLSSALEKANAYRELLKKIEEDSEILNSSPDPELKDLAKEELEESRAALEKLEQELKLMLIPKDPDDEKNAIVEIRAGTGGEEAALFAGDLYRMYSKYAERLGWRVEVMNTSTTEMGGFKEIIFSIEGDGVYGELKFESGVHRVQRVPLTESGGRVHTSAASVAG